MSPEGRCLPIRGNSKFHSTLHPRFSFPRLLDCNSQKSFPYNPFHDKRDKSFFPSPNSMHDKHLVQIAQNMREYSWSVREIAGLLSVVKSTVHRWLSPKPRT